MARTNSINVFNIQSLRKLATGMLLAIFAQGANADNPSSRCSLQEIKDWIETSRIFNVIAPHYPPTARSLGQKGRLLVNVTLDKERRIENASLRYPSGQKELDEGVLDMILGKVGTKLGAPACAPEGEKFVFDIPLNFQFNEGATPAKRELVLEYIRSTNTLEAFFLSTPEMTHKLFSALREKYPKATPEALEVIDQEVKQMVRKDMGEGSSYMEKIISLHQYHFTEDEIKTLISFNRSSLSRKVARVTPLITDEIRTYSAQWGKGVALLMLDRINARFREKGLPYELGPAMPPTQDKRPLDARQI